MVLLFALIYGLSRVEFSLLILIMGLMMVCELVNTAIEALVDLGTSSYDSLARIAKDVAAGAVFMCSFAAIGIGIALFGQWDKLLHTFIVILQTPFYAISFLLILLFGSIFIFKGVKNVHIKAPAFMRVKEQEAVKIYSPGRMKKTSTVAPQEEGQVKIYHGKGSENDH